MEIQEKARTRKKNKKKEEEKKEIDVGDLGLTKRAYNCLIRAGINNLDDLANMTEEQLRKVRNLGNSSFEEIVAKMREFGISFKTEEIKKNNQLHKGDLSENLGKLKEIQEKNKKKEQEKKEIGVGDLGLTKRAYNCLIRAGINNLDDLANMTEEQLRGVGNLGKKSFEEIVDKMQEFGISFKTKEKSELIQRLLEQQQTIKAQQEEINRLKKLLETPQQ